MHIREFTIDDFDKTAPLFVELDLFHLQNRKEIKPETATPQYRRKYLTDKLLNDKNAVLLIAEADNQVAGFVMGEMRSISDHLIFHNCAFGLINDLIVGERFRKTGVGKALMNEVESRLKAKGAEYVELKVYTFNKGAIEFYEQLGFKPKVIAYEK